MSSLRVVKILTFTLGWAPGPSSLRVPPRPSAPLRTYVPGPGPGALPLRKEPAPAAKATLLASEANLLLKGSPACAAMHRHQACACSTPGPWTH